MSLSPESLDTGDLILFSRPCHRFQPLGAAICTATKVLHSTPWDHVGVVVREKSGRLVLLEASFSGVVARDLKERLSRSNANAVAVRRLQTHQRGDEVFHTEAQAFLSEVTDRPYKSSMLQLFSAAVSFHPVKNHRRALAADLHAAETAVAAAERELARQKNMQNPHGGIIHARWLEKKLEAAASAREHLVAQAAASERSIFENPDDRTATFFCSELVALLYQRLGLLPLFPSSNEYLPSDFASVAGQAQAGGRLRLLGGASLAPELFLRGGAETRREAAQVGTAGGDLAAATAAAATAAAAAATAAEIANGSAEDLKDCLRQSKLRRQLSRMSPEGPSAVESALHRHRLFSCLDSEARWRVAERFERVDLAVGESLLMGTNSAACNAPGHTAAAAEGGLIVVESGELEAVVAARASGPRTAVTAITAASTFGAGSCFLVDEPLQGNDPLTRGSAPGSHQEAPHTSAVGQPAALATSCRWRLVAKTPVVCWRAAPALLSECLVEAESAAATSARSSGAKGPHLNLRPRGRLAAVLSRHPAFAGLDLALDANLTQRRSLEAAFFPVSFAAGDVVVGEGTFADAFYVLDAGTARVLKNRAAISAAIPRDAGNSSSSGGSGSSGGSKNRSGGSGSRSRGGNSSSSNRRGGGVARTLEEVGDIYVTVAELSPGACFGEEALLYNAPLSASVVCEDECVFWVLDRATFLRLSATAAAAPTSLHRFFKEHASLGLPLGEGGHLSLMTYADLFTAMGQPPSGSAGGRRLLDAVCGSCSDGSGGSSCGGSGSGGGSKSGSGRRDESNESSRSAGLGVLSFVDLVRLEAWLALPRPELQIALRLAGVDAGFHGVPMAAYDRLRALADKAAALERRALDATAAQAAATVAAEAAADEEREKRFRRVLFGLRGRRVPTYDRFVHALQDDLLCPPVVARYLRLLRSDVEEFRDAAAAAGAGADIGALLPEESTAAAAAAATAADNPPVVAGPPPWHAMAAAAAGGSAGRLLVAPLERLKMLQQTDAEYSRRGIVNNLQLMVREDGFRGGYYRGSGLNVLRVAPVLMLQAALYGPLQKVVDTFWRGDAYSDGSSSGSSGSSNDAVVVHEAGEVKAAAAAALTAAAAVPSAATPPASDLSRWMMSADAAPLEFKHLVAGGAAGVLANAIANPLEVVRSRLTVQRGPAAAAHGALAIARSAVARDGIVFLLTRGLGASALWSFCYIGLNYAALAAMRPLYDAHAQRSGAAGGGSSISVSNGGSSGGSGGSSGLEDAASSATDNVHMRAVACGVAAGCFAQAVAHPFDCIRRRMQVQSPVSVGVASNGGRGSGASASPNGYYSTTLMALRSIVAAEGTAGLYRGFAPMLLKFGPSFAMSYAVASALAAASAPT